MARGSASILNHVNKLCDKSIPILLIILIVAQYFFFLNDAIAQYLNNDFGF
jgi:hypothetical protein